MNLVRGKSKSNGENRDPNLQADRPVLRSILKKPSVQAVHSQNTVHRSDSQDQRSPVPSDSSVKVIARIRPVSGQERDQSRIVRKVSSNSLSVGDRIFTFDSVADSNSTQEDIFQLVGVPLVKNSLAGYNTSILSYGQTGSGKTYTMWGPPSAMVEGHYSPSSSQGIVPRIFNLLFSKIQEEQMNSEEKQINYQCRCSFLEIYKEQITDLLDPTQRNLQIRDDAKSGFYVENLSEEYASSFEDVTQILIKGLSNRKVGMTSINSKSSRSHIVFTCAIESWCKGVSVRCCSSSKISRISLVDLAGLERNKLDVDRESKKEYRNVKHSLSQLGYLVNILTDAQQSGKIQNVPYRSSCLTHLLQESLGGNAKLTVVCAISPDDRCRGETLSTLRFGQRAKLIQNKAVINEITEDDVNGLSDQIRQLKEELINVKSSRNRSVCRNGHYQGANARESLNQLRLSLNRSLILPHIDDDSEEEINIDEEDVRELCVQLNNVHASCEENSNNAAEEEKYMQFSSCISSFEERSDKDVIDDVDIEECQREEMKLRKSVKGNGSSVSNGESVVSMETITEDTTQDSMTVKSSLSILPCRQSLVLEGPALSDSPKIDNNQRRCPLASSTVSASLHHVSDSPKFSSDVLRQSVRRSDHINSSLRSSKVFSNPTESLAASLHRGLQIIDYHQRNSAAKEMSVSFSFEKLTSKQPQEINKIDSGMQTLQEEPSIGGLATSFICASCGQRNNGDKQIQDDVNMCIVPVDEVNPKRIPNQDDENALADAIREKRDLEKVCAEQASQIAQLNNLVLSVNSQLKDLKQDRESATSFETSEKDAQLNEIEIESLQVLSVSSQLKDLKQDRESATSFDTSEKDALLKEIESLKNQLQSFTDGSSQKTDSFALRQSVQVRKSGTTIDGSTQDGSGEELEKEREKWTEMESGWISLTEELRLDLESKRHLAEKAENELRQEKKCSEELDDALQRSIIGHARFVEHYVELQEKYSNLVEKHRKIMEGVAEVKRAVAKAGKKGVGSRFAESLAAELSALRVERERERDKLKKENKALKIQLRDTAEAVHAAGELLVRLREAEEAIAAKEEKFVNAQQEAEKVKKQMEKLKRKHQMQIVTMKQYLAESRLPESALKPVYESDYNPTEGRTYNDDDQDWRSAFGPLCQDRYDTSMTCNTNVKSHVELYRDK